MSLQDYFKSFFKSETKGNTTAAPQSQYDGLSQYGYNPIYTDVFDGEKTPGELGAVLDTTPDYLRLRLRAYDLNLKTDIIKIITGKFFKWVVGSGLKLQAEPNEFILGSKGYSEDFTEFKKMTEALFSVYSESNYSDYKGLDDLHDKAAEAFKTAFLGGDCLCVLRFENVGPNIQVIDGQQIETPLDETGKEDGNIIKNGIEINEKGEHVAFWIAIYEDENIALTHKRISAKNSNGNLIAWMIYGDKARIGHERGIPVISSILEKVSKLDRFTEASVKKAEETANIVYAFKHNGDSTGENILTESLTGSRRQQSDKPEETIYEQNGRTAAMLRQSTSSTVMNLTPNSELVSLSNMSETQFNEFFRAVFVGLCAAVDIPEEVALQKYEQNYSSSRAAINGWEFIVEIYRKRFAKKFYRNFYRFWLEAEILKGNIKSNGFNRAKAKGDKIALECYFNARFTGRKMPHIDPLKEAKAIRSLLGDSTAPLISHEQAAETMGVGSWDANFKKFEEENKLIPKDKDVTSENNISNKKLD